MDELNPNIQQLAVQVLEEAQNEAQVTMDLDPNKFKDGINKVLGDIRRACFEAVKSIVGE